MSTKKKAKNKSQMAACRRPTKPTGTRAGTLADWRGSEKSVGVRIERRNALRDGR